MSLRHDYLRKLIKDGIITLTFVKFGKNLVNLFTKPFTRDLVKLCGLD